MLSKTALSRCGDSSLALGSVLCALGRIRPRDCKEMDLAELAW